MSIQVKKDGSVTVILSRNLPLHHEVFAKIESEITTGEWMKSQYPLNGKMLCRKHEKHVNIGVPMVFIMWEYK